MMILSSTKSLPAENIDLIFPKSMGHSLVKNSGISIIIPTYKRVKLCHHLLESLEICKQKIKIPVEIIVVDNSPYKEAETIAKLCTYYRASYYHKTISVAAKRNFGANIAQSSLLLFIDSDCEATPNLIKEHFLFYERNPEAKAVLGSTRFKGKKSFIWPALQLTPFLTPFRLADQYTEQVWGPSNNFSIKKDVFEKIGGFNESFPQKPGGEDVDFGYRLYQQGYRFNTNPLARVYHTTETWNSLKQNFYRFFNWGKGEFYLYVNHPNYLYYDVPKSSLIFSILLIMAILILLFNKFAIFLPFLFLLIDFITRLILSVINNERTIKNLFDFVLAEVFILVYEWGLTWECLTQGWVSPLFCRLIVEKEHNIELWNQQIIYTWVTFLNITLTIGLWSYLSNSSSFC